MNAQQIAEKLIKLQDADLKLREKLIQSGKLHDGYDKEMQALHDKNAEILAGIIDEIGYPTMTKVGKQASEAAWLVIQHSISKPDFMRKCVTFLRVAVAANEAAPQNLAYLTDRIAVFEGKPQLYGTQFDWDEKGQLSPNAFDDLDEVNRRRKLIGLNTLEEQTEIIRRNARLEHQLPPKDFSARQLEITDWKKRVGWI